MKTRIIGTGSFIPPDILTNDALSQMVETSDEWIRTRTGICNRHIAEHMDNADMAFTAAKNAIDNAGIKGSQVGLIITATSTPDYSFPNQSSLVQEKLGAAGAVCFDISAACSGFIVALDIADSMLKTGSYEYALVIGSEKMSAIMNWKDRNTCVLFGDGAGAVVLKVEKDYMSGDSERGIIDSDINNDGNGACALTGGKRSFNNSFNNRFNNSVSGCFNDSVKTDSEYKKTLCNDMFIHMDGQAVFRFAVKKVPQTIETLLARNNFTIDDISKFILHQANIRIIESVAKRLGSNMDKFPVNLSGYGNTSSASIPILLDELNRKGELGKGEKIVLAGFGAGLSWGSILLEW